MMVKIFNPDNLQHIVIKKKTEIPLPDKVMNNINDIIDFNIRIEDDGTGKIVINTSFPGIKTKEVNICQDLIPQYCTHFCYLYGWGK